MEELRNLNELAESASARIKEYDGCDFMLPSSFKEEVKTINGSSIVYHDYSVIIKTVGNLKIFIPNQWFYIASLLTDFYSELIKYQEIALSIFSVERIKELKAAFVDGDSLIEYGSRLNKTELEKVLSLVELSNDSKNFLIRFVSDYRWWKGGKTIDRGDFYISPVLTCAGLVNNSQTYVAELCNFFKNNKHLKDAIIRDAIIESGHPVQSCIKSTSLPLQQIYFGAPGTGKSAEIKKLTTGKNPIRTTFHPDSDYSTFVGAYKPTMEFLPICDEAGEHLLKDGKPMFKEQITYKFVPQAFLMAYVEAWKKYAAAPAVETPKEQYLIIEEINRGNCAQIFGDLFQLLDRNDYGFSDYPIKADADMKKYLEKAFNGTSLDTVKDEIQNQYEDENIVDQILSGDILVLPSNLFIWATMNTSDQSLFPIDSAFKRRWDWQYVPISDAGLGYTISVNGCEYDWAEFMTAINGRIQGATDSEDKKIGYFFCKSPSGIIDAKMFVSKVLFYLWTDVFKDADTNDGLNPFYIEGNLYSFDKFFSANGNGTDINETLVCMFLDNLVENRSKEESEKTIVNSVITVNGKEIEKVNAIPYTAVEDFVKNNPTLPAIDVFNTWDPFKKTTTRRWFIADKALFDTLDTRNQNYSYKIECGDGNFVWINKDGWVHNPKKTHLRDTIKDFIKEINDNPQLGITITETPKPKPANVEAPKTEE